MNNGLYGFAKAPNQLIRISPPEWRNYQIIKASTSTWVVPQNVWQVLGCVWGGGANGTSLPTSGAGGGFAMGILDVTPGQRLPAITVGGVSGTSSIGTLISATGGSSYNSPGNGSVVATLRNAFTAQGGNGINGGGGGGAGSGSPYGDGGSVYSGGFGGAGWGGKSYAYGGAGLKTNSGGSSTTGGGGSESPGIEGYGGAPNGGSPPGSEIPAIVPGCFNNGFLDIPYRRLSGGGGFGGSTCCSGSSGGGGGANTTGTKSGGHGGIGGGGGHGEGQTGGSSVFGGGGGFGATGGAGGLGGGGGGGGSTGGLGGAGCVILYWTEGY